ncbi:hypothetical protein J7382_18155 [Shimia sp. R11_0]|uniref:hypothetical protein n=1 Tax=Shimia sp. R11_0 TaxID=2821096 RepID=UPI001ADBA999|nr:hypothetical protein [Shimia sp. R11_0]MBO9479472.1 hypothetical protein [Shimia sp. R11_0]
MTDGLMVADAPKGSSGDEDMQAKEISAGGEGFSDATLETIRALLAEADPVPEPKPLRAAPFARMRRVDGAQVSSHTGSGDAGARDLAAPVTSQVSEDDPEVAFAPRSWRRIEVVEGRAGRNLRRFLMSPRMVSLAFLCGVVIWQPWFIPMLALLIVSTLLLIGALIGQDRMARIVLYVLKRFVWADPALGRFLQKILPYRWHGVLHRPASEEDVWDGPIDPSFADRIARLRS